MNATVEHLNVAAHSRAPRPSFIGSVAGEMLKLRKQLSLWLMLLGGVLLFGLVFLIELKTPFGPVKTDPARFDWTALSVFSVLFNTGSGIMLLILTSRLVGMEYSAGTIRVHLGRGVGRLQFLLGKLAAMALFGLLLFAGYLVVVAFAFYVMVVAAGGSWSQATSVPHFGIDVGVYALLSMISMAACILLASFAAVLGRSLAFGIAAAISFFPADNFGTLILFLVNRFTNSDFWLQLSGYLLGPNLNNLGTVLINDHQARGAFTGPLVKVDATHALIVIGLYCAVFLAASALLSWRRDVLQ